jgi:phosphoglycolate phosphatase
MTIRAILLDKDGTLLDFDRTWGPATARVITRLADGDRAAFERLAEAVLFDPSTNMLLPASPVIGEAVADFGPLMAAAIGAEADAAFIRGLDRLFEEAAAGALVPIGDPAAVAATLAGRGYPLGIATNDSHSAAVSHAWSLGLEPHLTFIAGWDSGFGRKPGPGMVEAFARAIGVETSAVAMVGDSVHDIAAGRAAGARCIAVLSGPAPRAELEPLADHVIASIADLPALLDALRRGFAPAQLHAPAKSTI